VFISELDGCAIRVRHRGRGDAAVGIFERFAAVEWESRSGVKADLGRLFFSC
jgi:hypothetical protein